MFKHPRGLATHLELFHRLCCFSCSLSSELFLSLLAFECTFIKDLQGYVLQALCPKVSLLVERQVPVNNCVEPVCLSLVVVSAVKHRLGKLLDITESWRLLERLQVVRQVRFSFRSLPEILAHVMIHLDFFNPLNLVFLELNRMILVN